MFKIRRKMDTNIDTYKYLNNYIKNSKNTKKTLILLILGAYVAMFISLVLQIFFCALMLYSYSSQKTSTLLASQLYF